MKNEISSYFENIALLLLGIMAFALPILFSPTTTDAYGIPKQILIGSTALIGLLLWGAKMISDGKVVFRRTPFDIPVLLFTIVVFVGAFLSINRMESLISAVPLLFAVLSFYLLVNIIRSDSALMFALACLTAGAAATGLLSVLSYAKIYVLPMEAAKNQFFTPFGSLLDQALFLAMVLPIPLAGAWTLFTTGKVKDLEVRTILFAVASIIIGAGLIVTSYELIFLQKPLILPFETGFQTAFAAISQDAGRTLQGFLFGSGFGTYLTDFMRFKQAAFNANTTLWNVSFTHSSSFLLELLATTGFLGTASFVYLIISVVKSNNRLTRGEINPLSIAIILAIVGALVLPFSFTTYALLFILLGLFAASQALYPGNHSHKFFDVELQFVASKKSFLPLSTFPLGDAPRQTSEDKSLTKLLPVTVLILFGILAGGLGYGTARYVMADMQFQSSLIAASQNNGLQTYNLQTNAITLFPYRDVYHRVYSQININLANSIAASQPKDSSPSAEVQQTVGTLIQQGIDAGRRATDLSPANSLNWQNPSSIYRSLIGFGKDAEEFAVRTNQQAVALDSNNPQEYINLGGIYYQLGQWDNAIRQFQVAINLKPDYANSYYNLGHALEQKGDFKNALAAYQAVKQLVASDKASVDQIDAEIATLQKKIASGDTTTQSNSQPAPTSPSGTQQLGIPTPPAQLPAQKEQLPLTGPTITPTITPTPTK